MRYPFVVVPDPSGGYVMSFPDLPGCITQADKLEEIGPMADEAMRLWLETEGDAGPQPMHTHVPIDPNAESGRGTRCVVCLSYPKPKPQTVEPHEGGTWW